MGTAVTLELTVTKVVIVDSGSDGEGVTSVLSHLMSAGSAGLQIHLLPYYLEEGGRVMGTGTGMVESVRVI